ncbi:MAG TPA: prephenate dehydratase [Nitrospiria bacterium]|nr:prephenate dehydratase [Nitrospiria bacterium]
MAGASSKIAKKDNKDSKSIAEFRQQIDKLDEQILNLLNKRAKIVMQIGKLKKVNLSDLHAPAREMEIYERLSRLNKGPFPKEALRAVYREIISASLSLEGPLKVAYLGPKATFTHLASQRQFGFSASYVPANSIKDVFSEVERGRADYGVVPIENSTEGVVNHTLDMFVDSPLKIVGEVMQEVSLHLMNKSGKMEDVKHIYSHPQPFAQCRVWLENHLPHIPTTEVYSTARAAELCTEDASAAAIASELAAQLYGLQIIQQRIEDNINNFTRFLVISSKGLGRTGRDKTSVMFTIRDRVGALHDMLQPFSQHEINLTKIESRPSRKKAWEYIFFVDLEGHQDDDRVRRALEQLNEQCLFLKVLGSYPAAKEKGNE